jgi:hypothetical protein
MPLRAIVDDDPGQWFLRLMICFLLDLGIQANPGHYAHFIESGVRCNVPTQEIDDETPKLAHIFIHAFRDWAELCIETLNELISTQRIPVPADEGNIGNSANFQAKVHAFPGYRLSS